MAPLKSLYASAGSGSGDDPLAPVRALYEPSGPTTLEGPAPAAARSSTRIAPDVAGARREGESRALAGLSPLPSISEAPLSPPRGAPPIGVTDPEYETDRLIDEALERERERVELPEGQAYAGGPVDAFFGGAARRLGRITRKGADFAKRIPLPPGGRQVRDAVVDLAPDALEGAAERNIPTGSTQEAAANVGAVAAELGSYVGMGGAGVKTANAVLRNPRIWSLFGADLAASLPLTAALESDPETSVTESVARLTDRIDEDSPARPIAELIGRAAQSPSGRIAFGAAVDLITGGLVTAGASKVAARREARAIADELAASGVVSDRAHLEALDAARTPIDVDEAAESAGRQATEQVRAQRTEAEADDIIRAHDRETRRLRGPNAGDRPPRTDADRALDRELEEAADAVEAVRADVQPASRPRTAEPANMRATTGDLPSQADIGAAVERESDALPDAYEAARRRLDEAGGVPVGAVAHVASAGAGAGLGAAIGETPEERLRNAIVFAAGAALAPTLVRRAAERFRQGERIALERGQPVAAVKLADGTVHTGPSHADIVVGLPEDYRFTGSEVDGFMTSRGRFVDRDEAGALEGIARGAFSEDVARGADTPTGRLRGPDTAPAPSEPRGKLRGPQSEDVGAYDADDFLRTKLGETGLDAPTERLFREEFDRATAATGTRRVRVSDDEVAAAATAIGQDPAEVTRMLEERGLNGSEQLALMSAARENTRRMGEALRRLRSAEDAAGRPLTPEAVQELEREVSQRAELNNRLLSKWASEGSEAGRTLRARRLEAAAIGDPAAMLERARRAKRSDLDAVEQAAVARMVENGETDELAEYVMRLEQPSKLDKAIAFVKANMLSLPQTHAVNLTSNLLKAAAWPAERFVARLVDPLAAAARGRFTGEAFARTRVRTPARATLEGLREGATGAVETARYGITGKIPEGRGAEELARTAVRHRTDLRSRTPFLGPDEGFRDRPIAYVLDRWVNGIFGLLGGGDVLFRRPGYRRALAEEARVIARREGLEEGSDAFARRVAELEAEPTAALHNRAMDQSDEGVFMDPTGFFDRLDQAIQNMKRPKAKGGSTSLRLAAEVNAPFTRTLLGLADQFVDMTGLGVLRGSFDLGKMLKYAREHGMLDLADAEARAIVDELDRLQKQGTGRIGRATVGLAGGMSLGAYLASQDRVTLDYPDSRREQELWQAENRRENSILIDGKWRQADALGPYGLALMMGARIHDIVTSDDPMSAYERAGAALGGVVRTIGALTFAQGIERTGELLGGRRDVVDVGENYIRGIVRMPFPNLLRGIERVGDPTYREGQFLDDVPGLSRRATPRVDMLGRERTAPEGVWANLFSPTRGARPDLRESDPVLAELSRLGTAPLPPDRPAGITDEEWYNVQRAYGQRAHQVAERIMAHPDYGRADDEAKVEVLEKYWTQAKRRLNEQLKTELAGRGTRLRGPGRTGTGG